MLMNVLSHEQLPQCRSVLPSLCPRSGAQHLHRRTPARVEMLPRYPMKSERLLQSRVLQVETRPSGRVLQCRSAAGAVLQIRGDNQASWQKPVKVAPQPTHSRPQRGHHKGRGGLRNRRVSG